jgi:hypothetical protein
LHRLRLAICLGLLAALLIAPKLWLDHPFFGSLPPFDGLPSIPPPLALGWYSALVLLLVPVGLVPRPHRFIVAWCALFALRAAIDLSVWQPYLYQYAVMLLSLALVAPGARSDRDDSAALNVNRLIVACVYFWSGLNKLNYRFLTAGLEAVPGLDALLLPLAHWVAPTSLTPLSMLMPFVETAMAAGLLFRPTRKAAAAAAIAMHVLILLAIGPLGKNHNPVVWPWNVAMIAFVVLLFLRGADAPPLRIVWGRWIFHRVVLVLFAICPLLGMAGLWPASLSFRLYTFRLATADVYVTESLRDRMPPATRAEVEPVSVSFTLAPTGGGAPAKVGPFVGGLNISDWSERELHAFIPAEPRAFQRVFEKVCALAQRPADALLLQVTPPDVLTGATRQSVSTCKGEGPGFNR